jgi:preprotein translocase subunit SecB
MAQETTPTNPTESAETTFAVQKITAKLSDNLLWRIQLQQAGLYTLKSFEEGIKRVLNGHCINQLFPYAAATVSAMAVQGGFPPVI